MCRNAYCETHCDIICHGIVGPRPIPAQPTVNPSAKSDINSHIENTQ